MTKLSHLFNSLPKKLSAVALLALALIVPVATSGAQNLVSMEADTTVSNATANAGTMNWATSASAKYNEVVAIQVVYNNTEDPSSNKTTNNLKVAINLPSTSANSQTVTTSVSADNMTTINGSAKVNFSDGPAYLQYIPGTATWKHASTANGPMTTTTTLSDSQISATSTGVVANLGNENPCQAGSLVIQARVIVPGLTVDKFVRHAGDKDWSRSINANLGDKIQYEIAYKNTGNTVEKNVEFRDQLPKGITYTAGSTKLMNGNYPSGTAITSDAVVTNGILTGDYAPGATGFILIDAVVDTNNANLKCGNNLLRNIGFVQPKDMNYYYNTADVNVNKECQSSASFTCDLLKVEKSGDRKVEVTKFSHSQSSATFQNVTIDWGDGSSALTTDQAVGKTHSYAKNGSYTISAVAHFSTNSGSETATSQNCNQTVNFVATPPSKPTVLPETGAGNIFAIFALSSLAGAIAHWFWKRKVARV
jgi:uncharacterized repeat protein (TIGR01451 family)